MMPYLGEHVRLPIKPSIWVSVLVRGPAHAPAGATLIIGQLAPKRAGSVWDVEGTKRTFAGNAGTRPSCVIDRVLPLAAGHWPRYALRRPLSGGTLSGCTASSSPEAPSAIGLLHTGAQLPEPEPPGPKPKLMAGTHPPPPKTDHRSLDGTALLLLPRSPPPNGCASRCADSDRRCMPGAPVRCLGVPLAHKAAPTAT